MPAGMDNREFIARRVAQEMRDGYYVNLGIGIPTLVPNYLPPGIEVIMQSENGMLGVGPYPYEGEEDPDLINAGKEPVTEIVGCCYFSSAESFAMIRGGRINVSVLGALEVDEKGTLANWAVPGKMLKGMGGAMDLVAGTQRVIIAMEHTAKDGGAKIVKKCTLPITGVEVVDLIVTELAVIEVTSRGLLLREVAPGLTPDDVQKVTEPTLRLSPDWKTISVTPETVRP
jgi:3-oxoacid CoA-transferase subunit B